MFTHSSPFSGIYLLGWSSEFMGNCQGNGDIEGGSNQGLYVISCEQSDTDKQAMAA